MLPSADARLLDPAVETWALEVPARLDMQATRELRQQLQAQLPGKHVVVVTDGARFRALESLDAAWAEVEDALPEGNWTFGVSRTDKGEARGRYEAIAGDFGRTPDDDTAVYADTPVAALHALTAKLREAQP